MTVPKNSSGVMTVTFMIGSSRARPAWVHASRKARRRPARRRSAMESTSWYEPSTSSTLMLTTGYPPRMPDVGRRCERPSSTEGMYSRGITPLADLDRRRRSPFGHARGLPPRPRPRVIGHDVDDGVAVLAATAGLLDELAADVLRRAGDRLAVAHARRADLDADLHVAQQLVLDDLQVQLAHAGDDRLAGLLVVVGAERGILAADGRRARRRASSCRRSCWARSTSRSPARGSPCARGRSAWAGSQSVSPVNECLRPITATIWPASATSSGLAVLGVHLEDAGRRSPSCRCSG